MDTNSTKYLKRKFAALRVIGLRKIWFFLFGFIGGSRYENSKWTKRHTSIPYGKPKIWYHLIVGWVWIFWEVRVSRLVKISMLMMKASNNVGSNLCSHYTMAPLVTNPCTHELASPRRLCPYKWIENTSKNRKEQSWIADEWLAHESWGLTNRMSAKPFLID
jgi:hypothetical protein